MPFAGDDPELRESIGDDRRPVGDGVRAAGVGEELTQALVGPRHVERQVRRPALEDGEQGGDQLRRPRQTDPYDGVGLDAVGEQPVGEAVGEIVELEVRERATVLGDGYRRRPVVDASLEERGNGDVVRVLGRGGVDEPMDGQGRVGAGDTPGVIRSGGRARPRGRIVDHPPLTEWSAEALAIGLTILLWW